MNIESVQQEITTWDDATLRRLIAYAVVLQDQKSGRTAADDARKLTDADSATTATVADRAVVKREAVGEDREPSIAPSGSTPVSHRVVSPQ